jgi:transposase-like protein
MRVSHSPEQKAKIVLEVLKGVKTLSQIASDNNINPNMLSKWKTEVLEAMPLSFKANNPKHDKLVKELESKLDDAYITIGKLSTELEWCKKKFMKNVGN